VTANAHKTRAAGSAADPAPRPHAPQPGAAPGADATVLGQVVVEAAVAAGVLGCEMADIAGTIDDVNALARSQAAAFADIGARVAAMLAANHTIGRDAQATVDSTRLTRERVEQALHAAVGSIESGLAAVGGTLEQVSTATHEVSRIALQTRVVALNASVQAARAGKHGQTFAIVAASVRDLAEQVQQASQTIARTLAALSATVNALASRERATERGATAGLRASVDEALARFRDEFTAIESHIAAVAAHAADNVRRCDEVDRSARAMAAEVAGLERSLGGAAHKAGRLLSMSERLIEITAASGAATDDSPFIDSAIAAAEEVASLFEAAVGRGAIRLDELFDERYRPVPGTDPPQHLTAFVPLTDELLPPVQESLLDWSPRVTFCAAVDRNGFLPTHNLKYSKPQGPDPAWNAANCRNRRLFQDRTGKAAAANRKPFLVQTYRRDMGSGRFVILKEVDAPITVRGRHWGNVRLAFAPARG
jgi:methyl-accepting chemotaxis protein